ncbi:hypothetical protein H5410_038061 [Solanum commersonii]|uniref:Uncharacterized protein n=1 Tax=Solanum commersonii TaxID=4109 RepID=A0A9J5Y9P1_SOLCO|nr:hypothetical protein H5410_038061 [Solanum commersonii]
MNEARKANQCAIVVEKKKSVEECPSMERHQNHHDGEGAQGHGWRKFHEEKNINEHFNNLLTQCF